jgi:hypothetical protein
MTDEQREVVKAEQRVMELEARIKRALDVLKLECKNCDEEAFLVQHCKECPVKILSGDGFGDGSGSGDFITPLKEAVVAR